MAMNVGPSRSGDPDVMVDINTTPLIDVMLVLLIMLISCTASISTCRPATRRRRRRSRWS